MSISSFTEALISHNMNPSKTSVNVVSMQYDLWKKNKDELESIHNSLQERYINMHEGPRSERNIAYSGYLEMLAQKKDAWLDSTNKKGLELTHYVDLLSQTPFDTRNKVGANDIYTQFFIPGSM
jgi:hypothetical protein